MVALATLLISTAWAKPKFKILHRVPGGLFSGLTFDGKGNLYGVTGAGGDHNQGTIFELTPGAHGWTLTTLHSFDGQNGGSPNGGLIFDAEGNFYGTALGGPGFGGAGLAYEMVHGSSGWTFNVLYNFCLQDHCPDGGFPGALTMDGAGNLYGPAGGGTYGEGAIFELTPSAPANGWSEQVLYDFEGTNTGFGPSGPLIFDAAWNLYGTTAGTFNEKAGTVFMLKKGARRWKRKTLWQFNEKNGAGPSHGVVFDKSGTLYGTANGGKHLCLGVPCGVVFKLEPTLSGHWKQSVFYDFPEPKNGFGPSSGLVFDTAGNLYGTTGVGGIGGCPDGCGVVYRLTPRTARKWRYTVLHRFNGPDGAQPGGGVVLDGKGNLYGTAYNVVFEITP
jgi:uncharacterized repeat protein (TIGR03803 family)